MKCFFFSAFLFVCLLLSVTSYYIDNVKSKRDLGSSLQMPRLDDLSNRTFTKYKRIPKIQFQNRGGQELTKCQAFNFPQGLSVAVSNNGSTCVIRGTPVEAQISTEAFVVASNRQGEALARVRIEVNALVLDE